MPRTPRIAPGGVVFHVLNRSNAGVQIFDHTGDYRAFEEVLTESIKRSSMRLLAYCIMPNHWHMLLWPRCDGELGTFMQRVTTTHVRRWHSFRGTVGRGHLYQGAYKSFPVQSENYFLTVCRYIERNALRAGLVNRAEQWAWCSLYARGAASLQDEKPPLTRWPVDRPRRWRSLVNHPQTAEELEGVRLSVLRGRPYGSDTWQRRTAKRLGLESTFRSRGRPTKRR